MDRFSDFFRSNMRPATGNFLDLTVDEVYNVITHINMWPHDFNETKKLKLMKKMIKYFIDKEDYEKCAKLQRQVDELENYK
tara:strand:- start:686 stop:928 length:243 start_codon:yes stop_codon:yes gene_type:complete